MEKIMKFMIPWPTSTNSIWRTNGSGITYRSGKYRQFLKTAAIDIKATVWTEQLEPWKDHDKVSVSIALFPPDNRIFDIDNRVKAILDMLTICGIWTDDSCVDYLEVFRGLPVKHGKALIEIRRTDKLADPEDFGLIPKTVKRKGAAPL
jgi:crossover junction endodeoxyribonuclease RusA